MFSTSVESLERIETFLVDLALQLLGDTVRELVLLFDPFSSFSVFYGHRCYT